MALAIEEAQTLVPKPILIVFAAFQFDPEAAKDIDETNWPGVTLLKAQMNDDLKTYDLKKKRASNESFWLIGQPDVRLERIAPSPHPSPTGRGRKGEGVQWRVRARRGLDKEMGCRAIDRFAAEGHYEEAGLAAGAGFVERIGRRVGLGAAGVLAFRYAHQRGAPEPGKNRLRIAAGSGSMVAHKRPGAISGAALMPWRPVPPEDAGALR